MPKIRAMSRKQEYVDLVYTDSQVPANFAFVAEYTMFHFFVPAACNGLAMDTVFATDEAGTGAEIPTYYNGTAWTTLPQLAEVTTGMPVILMAENAVGWYVAPKFGSNVTTTVRLYRKG